MFDRLKTLEDRYEELNVLLSDPKVIARQDEFKNLAREHSELAAAVSKYRTYKKIEREIEENSRIAEEERDKELVELAREELDGLKKEREKVSAILKILLLPKDPRDERNVIIEIRAGTGGEEAALFAGDLFRMYIRYAESKKWKAEILASNVTGKGGYKEVIFGVQGSNVYRRLKYESGAHRVQRVPETETQGRVHTSAATVAILPDVEDVDVEINPADLKIDVYPIPSKGEINIISIDPIYRIDIYNSEGKHLLRKLDKTAATIAISEPLSITLTPPATFTKTS